MRRLRSSRETRFDQRPQRGQIGTQGLIVGIFGSALGIIIGFSICLGQLHYKWVALPSDIYFLEALPIQMKPLDFLIITVIAIALAYVGAVYPARRAAKLTPVDAIREG